MNKLKILLINPPIRSKDPPSNMPLGLAILAGVIEEAGHNVAILDNNAYRFSHEKVIEEIKNEKWDLIGMGSLVTTYSWQKEMFRLLRKEFPTTLLLIGGGIATSLQNNIMEWIPEIDIAVIGEGEKTILQIIDNLEKRSWENVKGIIYRGKDGNKLINTGMQPLLTEDELNKLPFPKFDLLPLEEVYFKNSAIPLSTEAMACKRRISIEASRGCPFRCSFCIDLPSGSTRTHSKGKVRYYNPKRVIELIKHVRLKYGIDFITFTDENFMANKDFVFEFCDLLEKEGLNDLNPPLLWGSTAHVNTLSEEMLKRLRECGCSYLDLGIESMNKEILTKAIGKGSTPERNEWAVKACIKAKVYPITNFLMGFPEDTIQSMYDSVKFWIDYKLEVGPFFVTPYPMTDLFEKNKEKIIKEFGTLENYIIECSKDVSITFVVNLTKYNDAELLGLKQIMMEQNLDGLKKFAKIKGEKIKDNDN